MKLIKEFIFGRRAEPVCQIKTTLRTFHPQLKKPINYGDWCEEFNVSMLHGKQSVHLENN